MQVLRKLAWSMAPALVALPLFVMSAPAQAEAGTLSAEAQEDLELIAQEKGLTFAEAQARYGWEETFAEVVNRLQDTYPEEYAGESINDGIPWIAFKGPVPQGAVDLTKDIPVPVTLIPDKGYSEAELKKTLEDHHYRVFRHAGIVDVSSGYDIETGAITIEAFPAEQPKNPDDLLAQLQPAQARSATVSVTVKLADKPSANAEAAYLRGGGMLNNGTASHCTSAFVIEKTDGTGTGISTAHHCAGPASLRYYRHGTSGSNYTTVERRNLHGGTYGDMAWYSRGGYTPSPTFYYTWDRVRDVTRVLRPARGQSLCNFGRNTGRKCSTTVYSVGECNNFYCGLIAATAHVTDRGDSGGPWYFNTTAYGIHHGGPDVDGKARSVFTPASNLPIIGARVLTR
ncbi:S1 family peptidase [Nonomuraea rubra]|uniref:S1 family peptidase n=1 Tax=Nonomuraea rubra TaxID=46180 RepID=UPI00340CFE52